MFPYSRIPPAASWCFLALRDAAADMTSWHTLTHLTSHSSAVTNAESNTETNTETPLREGVL